MSTIPADWRVPVPRRATEPPAAEPRRKTATPVHKAPLHTVMADCALSGECPWFRGDGAEAAAHAFLHTEITTALKPDALDRVEKECYFDLPSGRCVHLYALRLQS